LIKLQVFEELQSIFLNGDQNRAPTNKDFQQMKYVEMVIKETLRLFPPLPFLGRKLDEDMQIGEYMCPAGNFKTNIYLWYIKKMCITNFKVLL